MRWPRWLANALRDADDALDTLRDRPRRIVFDARTPMNYVMWRPVAERLAADPRIEQWHMAGEEPGRPYALYEQAGVSERVISRFEAQLIRFDLYVCADFVATWLKRRVRRVHIFHGVAGKYGFDTPDPSVGRFDAFFFVNRDRLLRYRRQGVASRASAYLIGMPKVDRLVDGSLSRQAVARRFGLDPDRPTVLYAPTWSPHSTLPGLGLPLVTALAARGLQVLVKLHDRMLDPRAEYSGGVDWGARFAALERAGTARVARDPDSTPALAAANLLVTDHSSVGFEFLLLDRPLVVLDAPELLAAARVNPDHLAWLRQAGAVAGDVASAVALVEAGLANPRAGSPARRGVAQRLFYRPGTATERAVAAMYRLLDLAPPRALEGKEPFAHARVAMRGDPGRWRRQAPPAANP